MVLQESLQVDNKEKRQSQLDLLVKEKASKMLKMMRKPLFDSVK